MELVYDKIVRDKEHEGAILFEFADEQKWIPRSLCEVDESKGVVDVSSWFVEKEELEGYAL